MENIILPFGRKTLNLKKPDNLLGVVKPREGIAIDIAAVLKKILENPIGLPALEKLVKRGHKVAIVIPDKTRRNPAEVILPELVNRLELWGASEISLIIANAVHEQQPIEKFSLSEDILGKVKVYNHCARRKEDMVKIGEVFPRDKKFFWRKAVGESGRLMLTFPWLMLQVILRREHFLTPFLKIVMLFLATIKKEIRVNKAVAEADLVIVIGSIIPHLMAGFSGGAKGIIPGVAGLKTIGLNHFLMLHPKSRLGLIEGNVLREDLERGAGLLKKVFIINAIYDGKKQVVGLVGGAMIAGHREGVRLCREISEVKIRKADIIITADSFPEAINIYQSLKLIAPAAAMVNSGGVIICVAECSGGEGELTLFNRLFYHRLLKEILPRRISLYFLSEANDTKNFPFFLKPISSLEEGIESAYKKIGREASILILSGAGLIVPRA